MFSSWVGLLYLSEIDGDMGESSQANFLGGWSFLATTQQLTMLHGSTWKVHCEVAGSQLTRAVEDKTSGVCEEILGHAF